MSTALDSQVRALEQGFARMGARILLPESDWAGTPRLNVVRDSRGEAFSLAFRRDALSRDRDLGEVSLDVLEVQPKDRHLLLLVRQGAMKSKLLCGHDERHWFVAAVPEAGVTGVRTAKLALEPAEVRRAAGKVKAKRRLKRRNEAFLRQGEWFFVPSTVEPPAYLVLRNEPLSRGGGSKEHRLELAYRRGGETVYVSREGRILTARQWAELPADRRVGHTQRTRDPELYARGRVSHPDHATISLPSWCRVFMNTERAAQGLGLVAFLD